MGALAGPDGAVAAPLATTIDGVPLRAEFVAGRRIAEGRDFPLAPEELHALATRLANDVRSGSKAELKSDAGRFRREAINGEQHRRILWDDRIAPAAIPRVIAHEIGHAADDAMRFSGGLPIKGFVRDLRANYNTGTNQNPSPRAKPDGPEHHGYSKGEVADELKAESFRAYLTNPNYFKTEFPELAAAMRGAVNDHPVLSRYIQLNANPETSASVPLAMQIAKDSHLRSVGLLASRRLLGHG